MKNKMYFFSIILVMYLSSFKQNCVLAKDRATISTNQCISKNLIKDSVLISTINKYLKKVEYHEIPILVEQRKGDTTLYYLSSFIHSRSISKNIPNRITILGGRELLLYNSGYNKIDSKCQKDLLYKYRSILHVDKMNVAQGHPAESARYYAYDPVWAKITVYNGKIVDVNEEGDPTRHIPVIDHSF